MTQNCVGCSKLWASVVNEKIKNCIHEVAKFTDICTLGHRGRNLLLTIKTSVKFRRPMGHDFFNIYS